MRKQTGPSMKKILFIGGSLNQTRMLHKISTALEGDHYFTPFYAHGIIDMLARAGLLSFTILGGRHRKDTLDYIEKNRLKLDIRGNTGGYDLVITGTDLIIQKNIRNYPIVLVQEGMMDQAGWVLKLVRALHLPRWMANTAATGLSDAYDVFCVASNGNRDLFIQRGVRPDKIRVTGIPNFDNANAYLDNSYPDRDYILAATSNGRETFKPDKRRQFLEYVKQVADTEQKPIIFKLHPNEDASRAEQEIREFFPDASIIQHGDIGPMIANSLMLVSEYSSVLLLALAMNKEVRCSCNLEEVRQLLPIQNGGKSAQRIARICQRLLDENRPSQRPSGSHPRQGIEWLPLQ